MPISPIGSDHIEQLSRAAEVALINPAKSCLQYFFPFIGAFFNGFHELRIDPSLEAAMPSRLTAPILAEITNLTNCAQIEREVVPYIALSHTFSNCGGSYSLTKPALFIPEQHLFRKDGHSAFTQERADENLAQERWIFSDNETRFFIARELGQIKESSALIKTAVKVAILVAVFIFFATKFSAIVPTSLFIGALGLYILSERVFQARADLLGVQILSQRGIRNPKQVAIAALEKMRQQNLYRRENSTLARLYILESGDNLLDFLHPFLSTRIERINNCEGNF
ncbi:MAG: M56 family metallopeptidase [Parachlamydiales bacterium]|nr:M56 family metallopeptidase [Parachlamydiales bacterium]